MADHHTFAQTGMETLGTELVVLNVLCFLDVDEIQKSLVTDDGLRSIALPGFPKTMEEFHQAQSALTEARMITSISETPSLAYEIGQGVKAAVMHSLTEEQRLATFNAATMLVSTTWPFLDTFNITRTDRLKFVREHMAHVISLKEHCLALERSGLMPDTEICALLHEEAWFQMMQTTVDDMHLGCFYNGLPLASRILRYNHQHATERPREVDYDRLLMNQSRAESISASMLGNKGPAVERRLAWIGQLFAEIDRRGLSEDYRTIPMKDYEIGMTQLYCDNVDDRVEIQRFKKTLRSIEFLKVQGEYDWAMPQITLALMHAHTERDFEAARGILLPLLHQHTQRDGVIFDDTSSLQTGIILYAMGTITYFEPPEQSTVSLQEALGFLRRAVDVLKFTHGEQALWTLAATYRMAVCLHDLGEYRSAVRHLNKVCAAFRGYHFRFGNQHEGGLDIMWQKVRAMWKLAAALMGIGTVRAQLEAELINEAAVELYYDIGGAMPGMEDCEWDWNILPLYR